MCCRPSRCTIFARKRRCSTAGATDTSLVVRVNNLTNELYAEFANASFFRPEPRRNVSTAIVVGF